jgi:hypothetical protein
MALKFKVEECGEDIVMRFELKDLWFLVSRSSLDLYLDEEIVDSLTFHLQAILEDRARKKDKNNC